MGTTRMDRSEPPPHLSPPTAMLPQYPPQSSYPPPPSRSHGNGMNTPTSELRGGQGDGMGRNPHTNPNTKGPPDSSHYSNHPPPTSPIASKSNGFEDRKSAPSTTGDDSKSGAGASKKRARRVSTSTHVDQPPQSPSRPSGSTSKAKSSNTVESPPAVLVREKKQKACSNCRRAKLKCIVDKGETDCVRCKARKEKCVFYPRSHDEDWQQTLTSNVYSAINHLTSLSSAVQHILHHLVAQRLIPPMPGTPLEMYDAPERDMGVLQGWGAERNRELGEDGRKRRRYGQDGEDEEEASRRMEQSKPGQGDAPFSHRSMSMSERAPPFWTPQAPHPSLSGGGPSPMMDHPSAMPIPIPPPTHIHPSMQHRFSAPELPPFRPQPSGPVQLTPTSELDIPQPALHGRFFNGHSFRNLSQPGGGGEIPRMPPPPTPGSLPPGQGPSPIALQHATPTSLVESSPASVSGPTSGPWLFPQHPPSTTGEMPRTEQNESGLGLGDSIGSTRPPEGRGEGRAFVEDDGEEIYGSTDGRATIITKGIIPPRYASTLVGYFHSSLAPHLYGYHLQLRQFPYLPDGPKTITPFILAVECLLASERLPGLYAYHGPLVDDVLNMLLNSPAESWQTFQGSRETRAATQEQALGHAFVGEDDWDPELGIGPEEIVAACALATFIAQREQARHIAEYAFMWARGWASYLKQPSTTFVEMTGLVPPLRRPSELDMARVWLLSYVVAGQEAAQVAEAETSLHDHMRWCRMLLSDTPQPSNPPPNPHDVLLVFHARLLALLRTWQRERSETHRSTASGSESISPPSTSRSHKRLASRTNASLDWWQEDLKLYNLEMDWTAQIQLDWLNAKVLVNSVASKNLWGGPDEDRLREASRAWAVDAAMQLLQRCSEWSPADTLTNLPHAYLRMIALAASEVVEVLTEVEQGSFSRAACPVTRGEVVPILMAVSRVLFMGGLQDGHGCRMAAHVLRSHVDNLNRLKNY